tara:strand:+ start:48 stop:788 length:741 start_codon:yes stop_codon:yes gene_type:complete
MYQQNQGDAFTNAVSILTSATLRSPGSAAGLIGSSVSTLANLPVSKEEIVYASGGTFLGSALPSTRGPGTGLQNNSIGSSYLIRTDNAGNVDRIQVIQTRPDGLINNAAVAAPTNPGAGPNIGVTGQTIVFDATAISNAFGIQNPVITGVLTVTLLATDLQPPFSGGTGAAVDGIYEADMQSGAKGFGLYVGSPASAAVKVELVSAPANQTVTLVGIAAGTTLNGLFRKVHTTDAATTATSVIALY